MLFLSTLNGKHGERFFQMAAEDNVQTIEIEYLPIQDLTEYKNNSRTHEPKQVDQICRSIQEYGFTNPILIDESKTIIAGHGRMMAAEKMKLDEVPTITLRGLTEEQRRAYVIADNKLALNAGWNEKMLMRELFALDDAKFDLSLTGFEGDELKKLLDIDVGNQQDEEGEIGFSEEIGEAHNYVVLYFSNDVDWLSAQTHFDLKSVHSKRANGKAWSKGIGRVIDGAKYLTELKSKK